METVDSRMTVMDDVDTAVSLDSVASSTAGTEKTVDNSLDCVDNQSRTEAVRDEDVVRKCVDSMRDSVESADTEVTEDSRDSADLTGRSLGKDDLVDALDRRAKEDSESDGDSTNEGTCLEAMTPYGQDHYLRLGDTPRRRSALRLSRIIARQQLLRRLSQGRNRELWQSDNVSISYCWNFSVIRFVKCCLKKKVRNYAN